jgi:hypothetical protein
MKKPKADTPVVAVEQVEKPLSLEDIIPQDSTVVLNGREFKLRKVNLADEMWLKSQGNINVKFQQEDMEFISKFAFRQLVDKAEFLPVTIDGHDDDGNPIKFTKTGPYRLLEAMHGANQRLELIRSLCELIGVSRPLFDKMMADEVKKNPTLNPVGGKSTT